MKGLILREFVGMAMDKFGVDVGERILSHPHRATPGFYDPDTRYSDRELLVLAETLGKEVGLDMAICLKAFGSHMVDVLATKNPALFATNVVIPVFAQVAELFPDLDLSGLAREVKGERSLRFVYKSPKPFGHICHGLLSGMASHFVVHVTVESQDLNGGSGSHMAFNVHHHQSR